jgi:hypothetical protein
MLPDVDNKSKPKVNNQWRAKGEERSINEKQSNT